MADLFSVTTLTAAINNIKAPGMKIFNRLFRPKLHMAPSENLQFDIISGSERVLKNISTSAPAQVTDKTGRKTVTLKAPRLAEKRLIRVAELNALRKYGGGAFELEQMKARVNRELTDIRNEHDRTLEYWASRALSGKILDSDLSTVLVDYNMDSTHTPTLSGIELFTDSGSDPITKIREFKLLIEDDSGASITGWLAYLGSKVMDALLGHAKIRELLRENKGVQISESGVITKLAEVDLEEYNSSFLDDSDTRRRFIPEDVFCLIGLSSDVVDCPYAPILDLKAPGGVGNMVGGKGKLFFAKSWEVDDPSGLWLKGESRPLPVLQRPGNIVYAKVV